MKRILIPIDFTEASLNGLDYAFEFAKKAGGELHLFHAVSPHPMVKDVTTQEDLSDQEEDAKQKLEDICERLASKNKRNGINYMFHVEYGFAEDQILKIVKEKSIDFIIMGTKGSESSIFGGSLSADILSKADCPVLVIPQDYNFTDISKIAFATDLKGNESEEVKFVVEFARLFGAHIAFLNIQKNDPDNVQDIISTGFDLLNVSEYQDMSFHVIEEGDVLEGIQYFAKKERADMIVMSTYRKNLFERILAKSHTRKIVNETHLPLLAMHKEKVASKVR